MTELIRVYNYLAPFFITFEYRNSSAGKIPFTKDRLNICSNGLNNSPKQFLITVKLMSSKAELLLICSEKNLASFSSFISSFSF